MDKRKKKVFVVKIGGCEKEGDEKFGLTDKSRSRPYRMSIGGTEKREVGEHELRQFLGIQMKLSDSRIDDEIRWARLRYDEEMGE